MNTLNVIFLSIGLIGIFSGLLLNKDLKKWNSNKACAISWISFLIFLFSLSSK